MLRRRRYVGKKRPFTVDARIMAALGCYHSEEVSSAILANSVNADPTFIRKSLRRSTRSDSREFPRVDRVL